VEEALEPLVEALRVPLQDLVKEVRFSKRLTDSPACLVAGEHDMSPQLERLLRRVQGEEAVPRQKRILEINPRHDLIRKLAELASSEESSAELELQARMLLDYALLAEGSELPDPRGFRDRLDDLMLRSV
jgi:molecular chaperone HtpG